MFDNSKSIRFQSIDLQESMAAGARIWGLDCLCATMDDGYTRKEKRVLVAATTARGKGGEAGGVAAGQGGAQVPCCGCCWRPGEGCRARRGGDPAVGWLGAAAREGGGRPGSCCASQEEMQALAAVKLGRRRLI